MFKGVTFKKNRPTIVEYLSGGLLGNVPLILVVLVLSFFDPTELPVSLENFAILASLVIGAAVAAFYVVVGVQSRNLARVIAVGMVTGGFCYLINLALSYTILSELAIGDYWKIFTFIPGAVIGGFLRTKHKKIMRRPPPSDTKTS